MFLASLLIGLRDGLEASLVVAILIAFLNRAGRREHLRHVWAGVGGAVLICAAAGVLLTSAAAWLGAGTRLELFEAVTSLAAVALVTWMIFWMRRTARTLRGELTGRLENALRVGGWAVAAMAFFAVLREGVEMVLLVFAAAEGAGGTAGAAPLAGMLTGVAAAVALGWAVSTATARVDLGRFFTWTGALLILVAAGILKYGVHGLQSAGVLPGGNRIAFDLGGLVDPASWYATLLAGTVNLTPRASVLEIGAWLAFAMVMLALFFRPAQAHSAPRPRVHAYAALGAVAALASCGGPSAAPSASDTIAVTATDTQCRLSADHAAAGPRVFEVRNEGGKVTEFYVYAAADRVVGEVENIAPGLSRTLHVELTAGTYTISCRPGMTGAGIRAAFTVTGPGGDASGAASADPALAAAAAAYQDYVRQQAAAFVERTTGFVAAVKAGDRAKAQALYAPARAPYERIETVAESFADLDPRIDARDGDLDPGTAWTGYHRIEQQLWGGGDLTAVAAVADQLLADVTELRKRLDGVTLTALGIANGAKSLLDEVATKKVTGEEDRYSHTDLWDFAANVEGCRAAIAARRPAYDAHLDDQFAAVDAELAKYRQGDGFVAYDSLQAAQVQRLAAVVNALAEQVSAVPAAVAHR
ncbi:iron uptake system protein EfeO [Dactylosporangium sp. NPDC051485]|uniref:iron uptake system protein EfeO n=1 Tax=Dactylosporangium sp. NPDC051485 TaxID=3154846 RepID=UPI003417662B